MEKSIYFYTAAVIILLAVESIFRCQTACKYTFSFISKDYNVLLVKEN